MKNDRELEDWQAHWRAATPPLPDVDRWVRKYNRRFVRENVLAFAIFGAGVAAATVILLGDASPEIKVIWGWVLVLYAGGVVLKLWNRRGSWRPSARTTRAFLELAHRRALSNLRALRTAWWTAVVGSLVAVGLAVWASFGRSEIAIGMACGLAGSLLPVRFYMSRRRRRCLRDREEAERLLAAFEE